MVELDWTLRQQSGVSLVELRVTNAAETAVRVRVANELTEPLWPPRREGLPEPGWDDGGWEGIVPATSSMALGYASPAEPSEPPVSVAWTERAASTETRIESPEAVVQSLGDASPPRDAIPRTEQPSTTPDNSQVPSLPPEILDWLATLEADIVAAERLSAVESLPEATDAVDSVGGLDEVKRLDETIESAGSHLESLNAEIDRLEARIEATEIPVDTLAELA